MPDVKKEIHFAKLSADGKTAIFASTANVAEALRKQPGGMRSLSSGVTTFSNAALKSRIKDLENKPDLKAYVAALQHGLDVMETQSGQVKDATQAYGKVGASFTVAKVGAPSLTASSFGRPS